MIAKRERTNNQYIDSDFILVSVAEVQQLWPRAQHVMAEKKKGVILELIEGIPLFRQVERSLDERIVGNTIREARWRSSKQRLKAHEHHEKLRYCLSMLSRR